jgi:hypothetical protein
MKKLVGQARIYILAFTMVGLVATSVFAVPGVFNQTGRLLDQGGKLASGAKTMSFGVYDSATAGNVVWASGDLAVTVTEGFYSVDLGTIDPALLSKDNLWIQVTVNTEALSPRTKLSSAALALNAGGMLGMSGVTMNANAGSLVGSGNGFQVLGGLAIGNLTDGQATPGAIRWTSSILQISDGVVWTAISE